VTVSASSLPLTLRSEGRFCVSDGRLEFYLKLEGVAEPFSLLLSTRH
jgi:hypothetical protein